MSTSIHKPLNAILRGVVKTERKSGYLLESPNVLPKGRNSSPSFGCTLKEKSCVNIRLLNLYMVFGGK